MPLTNSNGPKHGLSGAERNPPDVEMAAFDELPFAVRRLLDTFPLLASAVEIRDKINGGATVGEVLWRYRMNLRRIPLSFVREEK